MQLGLLSHRDIAQRLTGPGLGLRLGPFAFDLRSPFRSVAEGLAQLYPDYELTEAGGFVDFHASVAPPNNLRRWIRPQTLFALDGRVPFKPLPADQAMAMLEWGLNWVISNHAHQYLILHAAVVERGGQAMILPAPPGSGKSTLTAGLIQRDWRLLSDELTLVRLTDGMIVPMVRPVSLKNRSIDIVRGFGDGIVIGPLAHDTAKGTVAHLKPPADSVRRMDQPARPAWIVFPRYTEGGKPTCEARGKTSAFIELVNNAFNYSLLGISGFDALAALLDQCSVHSLGYGSLDQAFVTLDRHICV